MCLHKKERNEMKEKNERCHTDLPHACLACFLQFIVGGVERFEQSSNDLLSGLWQVVTCSQGI